MLSDRVRKRWAPAAGGAIGSLLVFALLVCSCVFLALTGPALSQGLRTHAMRQQLAAQGGPLRNDLVATANWYQFDFDWGQPPPLPEQVFEQAAQAISAGLAQAVPLSPGAWTALTTTLLTAPEGFAGLQYPTHIEVTYRTSLTSYTKLISGTYSDSEVPAPDVGVVITPQTAARFRLHPGSTVRLSGFSVPTTVLYVTGIVREVDPASSFWISDILPGAPVFQPPVPDGPAPNWQGGAFADPGQFSALEQAYCPQPEPGLAINCDPMQVRWEVPFDLNAFSADQAQALLNDLNTATSGSTLTNTVDNGASDVTVGASVISVLSAFIDTQASVMSVLWLLFVSLLALGLAVITLAAQLIVSRRDDELRMLRARGATVGQLARRVLAATAIAVPAAAAGGLLALIPIRHAGAPLGVGWRFAGVVLLVALACPPLLAAWRHRRAEPTAVNPAVILTAETRAARYSMAAKRRIVAGATMCAAAVAILLLLREEGLPAPGSVNWVLTIAPVVVAIPAALLAMRIYPLVVRLLLRLWHRVTATGYVALASSVRVPAMLSAYTVVLALTLAAFCGMVNGAISRGQVAASWQATGADATVSVLIHGDITPAVLRRIAAVPGTRHVAAVSSTTWILPDGTQITLFQVDPAQYAALTSDTPFPPVSAAALAITGTTFPVLADPATAAALGGHAAEISGEQGAFGQLRIRVAGTVASSPAVPSGGRFAIMATHQLPEGTPTSPNLVLITGDVNHAALESLVAATLPVATVIFRSTELSLLTGEQLVRAATLLMTLGVVACSLLAVVSLLFGLALGARERQVTMARLAVMGDQRDTRFVLVNALPALLGAAAAAIVCALLLPVLIGPALDLSAFTGSGASVQLHPDLLALCVPGAAILVLGGAALTVQTRRSRRDTAGLLRVGS